VYRRPAVRKKHTRIKQKEIRNGDQNKRLRASEKKKRERAKKSPGFERHRNLPKNSRMGDRSR